MPEGKPQYTSETWLSPADPNLEYGDLLPYSFKPGKDGLPVPGTVKWAVPNFVRGAVNDLALTLAAPRNALLGKYTPEQMQSTVAPAMTSTLMGLGIGMPAPAGSARIFAGMNARTAPLDLMEYAEQSHLMNMGANGAVPMDVRQQVFEKTKIFLDHDGKWKWEIPDVNKAKLKLGGEKVVEPETSLEPGAPKGWGGISAAGPTERVSLPTNKHTFLKDLLEHDELFEAYPWLKSIPVWGKKEGGNAWGTYHPVERAISMAAADPAAFRSTLLHEVQHAIQHRENFAFGGNVEQFLPKDFQDNLERATATLKLVAQDADEAVGWKGEANRVSRAVGASLHRQPTAEDSQLVQILKQVAPEKLDKLVDLHQELKGYRDTQNDAYDKYWRIAGEVEARNVQERLSQGDTHSHPWRTTGYPTSGEQIFQPAPAWGQMPYGAGAMAPQGGAESFHGWHGTPHEFEPVEGNPFGEFRDDKIGTGEGAQVYGHGHYVAGRRGTAEEYQRNLSKPEILLGGNSLHSTEQPHYIQAAREHLLASMDKKGELDLDRSLLGLDRMKELSKRYYDEEKRFLDARQLRGDEEGHGYIATQDRADRLKDTAEDYKKAFDWVKENKDNFSVRRGNLLKAIATPDEHELLDWDEALGSHHQSVLDKIEKIAPEAMTSMSGEDFYNHWVEAFSESGDTEGLAQKKASEFLKEAGIPGIKYADQGSRNLTGRATYSGEMGEPQHRGLALLNAYGHSKWGKSSPATYVNQLVKNFTETLANTPEKYISGRRIGLTRDVEALKSLDVSKLKVPKKTYNYVIFDPKHIKIVGRNGKMLEPHPDDPHDVGGWPE